MTTTEELLLTGFPLLATSRSEVLFQNKQMVKISKSLEEIFVILYLKHILLVVGEIQTCEGNPNRFLVRRLNHSATMILYLMG